MHPVVVAAADVVHLEAKGEEAELCIGEEEDLHLWFNRREHDRYDDLMNIIPWMIHIRYSYKHPCLNIYYGYYEID